MNRLPRFLQPVLIVILLVSVFALAFVAYTQHQERQHWESEYFEAFQVYPKPVGIPVTLLLSRFGNTTDILSTKFINDSKQKIEPLAIELAKGSGIQPFDDVLVAPGSDYVTFWFDQDSLSNRVWIRLQNWNDYIPFSLPFTDWAARAPPSQEWEKPLWIP